MFEYQPKVQARAGHYFGSALVGTYSVIIGWSVDDDSLRVGLRGFAIRRTEFLNETGEELELRWLGGYKRFLSEDDGRAGDVGSLTAPFQRFRWNDYTLRSDRSYRYEVFPLRGEPGALTREEAPLVFEFSPTDEDDGELGIFVNRGVSAAKAYFQRFGDVHPKDVIPATAAYNWLSRGLKESLINFIDCAQDGDALHIAVYEFHDDEVAIALKQAISRNVDVQIVHDAKPGKHSTEKSERKIEKHRLKSHRVERTTVNISHNKLVVLLRAGTPIQVWTGSANFSENAFNYQTNNALVFNNLDIAEYFEAYFQSLTDNPTKRESKLRNRALMNQVNSVAGREIETTFFSPLSQFDILDAAVDLIENAQSMILVSSPFGLDKRLIEALEANDRAIVEYGLVNATAQKKVATLNHHNTRFFPPKKLKTYRNERWDAKAFGAHKIHAKTIIVDPYSDNPKVLTGSANFSKASCKDNDENAVLIVGDKRLVAVLTTEFMRMYDHYKSRWYIDKLREANVPLNMHLKDDDSWSNTAFNPNSRSHKFRDRIAFSE